jgi:ATP-dependent RNA helicase RhlE
MFKRGQVTCLVATEVAARGLDIKELPQVVNYELPNVPEDYVHRIGRTGRAGSAGEAISLVSSDESGLLRDIERVLRRSIPTVATPVFKILESAPQPASLGNRGAGERPGNRPSQGQGRQGHHGARDSRRAPSSGTRSFGQQQRGRFR